MIDWDRWNLDWLRKHCPKWREEPVSDEPPVDEPPVDEPAPETPKRRKKATPKDD